MSFPIRLLAGKSRQGVGIPDTRASIESEQNSDGSYRWVRLDAEATPDATQQLGDRIVAFLVGQQDRRGRRAEIASHLGMTSKDGRFDRALGVLQARKTIGRLERGVYALTD